LRELYRILKPNGKIFIVVRSIDDPDRIIPHATYDENTCLTTYPWMDESGYIHTEKLVSRYFHSVDSISNHLQNAGFKIKDTSQHDEKLYLDFSRKQLSSQIANVIEAVAIKE
jgi:ubiquinone/menaquinone biosynthesis C-methylase UbiE